MRVGLVLQWFAGRTSRPAATRHLSPLRRRHRRGSAGLAGVRARLPDRTRGLPLFVVLVLAELAVPLFAERAGETSWHPHHIAERYGLFFIIVLGETILSTTVAVQTAFTERAAHPFTVVVQALRGVLIVFSLWWLSFSREPAEVLSRAREGGSRVQYVGVSAII